MSPHSLMYVDSVLRIRRRCRFLGASQRTGRALACWPGEDRVRRVGAVRGRGFIVLRFVLLVCVACVVAVGLFWLIREEEEIVPPLVAELPRPGLGAPPEPIRSATTVTEVARACDLVVASSVSLVSAVDVGPGDLVCLESGVRGPLRIEGAVGTATNPIIFSNSGDVTVIEGDEGDYAGIDIRGSSHLVITGAGVESTCGASVEETDQQCGIVIRGTGRGLAATERSDHLIVDHLAISETSHSGIFIKTGADEGVSRSEWTQTATVVTDNYLHDVGREGLYIGSSFYAEGLDPVLVGVNVTRNLVVDVGWDGIQVGSAVEDCSIERNRVFGAGVENRDDQRSGIINNKGSVCSILDNVVVGSAAQGIYLQGNGGNLVANNLVIQPGLLSPSEGDGITVSRGSNDGISVTVLHNTVVGAPRSGVRFRLDVGDENQVGNNLFVAVQTPITGNVSVAGNVVVSALEDAGFTDPYASDFTLTEGSPAVDAGADLEGLPPRDLTGWPRPDGDAVDAGAFEFRSGATR